MKVKDLKDGEVYVVTGHVHIKPSIVEKVYIEVRRDINQEFGIPDTEYRIYFFYTEKKNEDIHVDKILYAWNSAFGEDLSQNLGIFVSKEELLEHIQNQLDKLP